MSGFSRINMAQLPALQVIEPLDYETMLSDMKAEVIERIPELAPILELESDPAVKVLEACAYVRLQDRQRVNDAARANFLATSTGADLENLGAFYAVSRLVVQEADETVDPPIPEIRESDDALRKRIQLAPEGFSTAGPRGAYIFWALSASGDVKDASAISPSPGLVHVTILSHQNDGTPSNEILNLVNDDLNHEDRRVTTVQVNVFAAQIVTYQVQANLTLYDGPDAGTVLSASQSAINKFVSEHHRLGHDITLSGILAALHQPGVQNVQLIEPTSDLVIADNQAAFCDGDPVLNFGGRDV